MENYQKKLDEIIARIESCSSKGAVRPDDCTSSKSSELVPFSSSFKKPSLLLHACCGPCSSYVLEYLARYFSITILYYNPNIYPEEEYFRRLNELKNLLPRFPEALKNEVKLVEDSYDPEDFYSAIGVRENPELSNEAEKGERCRRCYEFRLRRAFEYAKKGGFDYFCTTLSISPFKDAEKINTIGTELEASLAAFCEGETSPGLSNGSCEGGSVSSSPRWLPSDFKKKGGFKRSLELSEEYGLYRQQYCGCVYSKNNTEKARAQAMASARSSADATD